MPAGHMYYLPISPLFFLILIGAAVALVALIQVGVLSYAYHRLGISYGAAMLILVASLVGSSITVEKTFPSVFESTPVHGDLLPR